MLRISCKKGTSVVAASASGPMGPHGPVYLGVFVLLVLVSRKRDGVYPGHKLPEGKGYPWERCPHLATKATDGLVSGAMFAHAVMGSESHHQWAAEL